MPFIPHTHADVEHMLGAIGANSLQDLFDEIPADLRTDNLDGIPTGCSEMEMLRDLGSRADRDAGVLCFAGGGSYDHHIPAAVWDLASRGEFMTCYTPYQAEASQGTLQLIYEYQSMMTALTGLHISNASVYDGASALGEAVLMALRAQRKVSSRRILMPRSVSPFYRRAVTTIVGSQQVEIDEIPITADGVTDRAALAAEDDDFAALVIPQPNFLGRLEDVHALTDWAHERGRLVIAVVNPLALALLAPPGDWGAAGADIAVGDGQPLGVPMASGGPSFGFMCARKGLERQLPGRIVGRTTDASGATGFVLTLQAREQHIRRAKATSNICTNQGLLVTAGTIHMALMGAQGLRATAIECCANTSSLAAALCSLDGVDRAFPQAPVFHEQVLRVADDAAVIERLAHDHRILGGIPLASLYPELGSGVLVCATEKRTPADIDRARQAWGSVLGGSA